MSCDLLYSKMDGTLESKTLIHWYLTIPKKTSIPSFWGNDNVLDARR